MKKNFLLSILVLIFLISCGGEKKGSQTGGKGEKVVLKVGAWNDAGDALKKVATAFEKTHPDVKIRFMPTEEHFIFEETVVGGSVPKSYIPAVEKGLKESLVHGVLAGYPVTNMKAVLYDGSYHDVDSSEMSFKIAANLAFKKGMLEAKPVLLEPIMELSIIVPEEYIGDIMGDINKKRGRVIGMESHKNTKQKITAEAPMAETFKYANDLKAMTQGRGYFEMKLLKYEEVPYDLAKKIIDETNKDKEK